MGFTDQQKKIFLGCFYRRQVVCLLFPPFIDFLEP